MRPSQYIRKILKWIDDQINNENLFPFKNGIPYGAEFQSVASQIFYLLLCVYKHIYRSHYSQIIALGQEALINMSLKHFLLFSDEFNLIEKREVYLPG